MKERGFDFYCGVPCSYLENLINWAVNHCDYISAASEGDAVAMAAGASIGGRKPVVLMQNSGLANAVSPLTSLTHTFSIPILGFVSLRGGSEDEPQHELMGQITTRLLDLLGIRWQFLAAEPADALSQLEAAVRILESGRSFFFVVEKGTFTPVPLEQDPPQAGAAAPPPGEPAGLAFPSRYEALELINGLRGEHTVLLFTTGKTGREAFEIEDHPGNFYMVGSMGCLGSLALGLALARPAAPLIAIDGDGSLLMRMGLLATNGCYAPPNLLHILLDNGVHDSTGGQFTVSGGVKFAAAAAAAGYPVALPVPTLENLARQIRAWQHRQGLTFLHLRIRPGSKHPLGRPRVGPVQVKERLINFLNREQVDKLC